TIGVLMKRNSMSVERRCLPIAAWPEQDRLAWEAGTRRADFRTEGCGCRLVAPITGQDRARLRPLDLLANAEGSVGPDICARLPGDESARRRLCCNALRELRSIHCRLPPAGALRRVARLSA